jgi:hypothetical protein
MVTFAAVLDCISYSLNDVKNMKELNAISNFDGFS